MLRIFLLHPGNDRASLIAQGAGLIQFRIIAGRDEPAVTGQQRRIGHQRGIQQRQKIVKAKKITYGTADKFG